MRGIPKRWNALLKQHKLPSPFQNEPGEPSVEWRIACLRHAKNFAYHTVSLRKSFCIRISKNRIFSLFNLLLHNKTLTLFCVSVLLAPSLLFFDQVPRTHDLSRSHSQHIILTQLAPGPSIPFTMPAPSAPHRLERCTRTLMNAETIHLCRIEYIEKSLFRQVDHYSHCEGLVGFSVELYFGLLPELCEAASTRWGFPGRKRTLQSGGSMGSFCNGFLEDDDREHVYG